MKKIKTIITSSIMILGTTFAPMTAQAWGPKRDLFTNENPATYATFNSIQFNAAVGDERDFVRIIEVGGKEKEYSNEVEVKGGKEYQVYIYYHNDASSTFNTGEYGYKGVAREVRLAAQFPTKINAGEKGTVSAAIFAANTNPEKVWDEAYLSAKEGTVELAYKAGSAKILNDWDANGSALSDELFSPSGTYLGINELNGVILGCDEYSGQVIFNLVATKVEENEPEEPKNPENPTNPTEPVSPEQPDGPGEITEDPTPEVGSKSEAPTKLPETGPAEIILATVVVLGLIVWGFYYFRSKNTLNKVKTSVIGDNGGEKKK